MIIRIKNKELRIKGFTLVELLVTIGTFSIIGAVAVSILFTTLRLSKKSDATIFLKNSGNSAISQITKQIRYAKSLDSPASCTAQQTGDITITSQVDNAQTTFSCSAISGSIASNSASLFDTDTVVVSDCAITCRQQTIADPVIIGISFTLSTVSASGIVESSASVPFDTSVTMRNFIR